MGSDYGTSYIHVVMWTIKSKRDKKFSCRSDLTQCGNSESKAKHPAFSCLPDASVTTLSIQNPRFTPQE